MLDLGTMSTIIQSAKMFILPYIICKIHVNAPLQDTEYSLI